MRLSRVDDLGWRHLFARDGFVLLRGLVPGPAVASARAVIAAGLDADESVGAMQRSLDGTFLPGLVRHPALLGLLDPARPAIASLLGLPRAPSADNAQIALRFPQRDGFGERSFGFHVDGFPSGANGIPSRAIHRHTLLVGVYLTPLRGPDRGNFVAWPGSHRTIAKLFRDLDAPRFLREQGAEALIARVRAMELGPGTMLEVEPGDVLLAHPLLGHGVADNFSLRVREAIYFRLMHPDDRADDPMPLLDETRFFARPA